MKATSTRHSKLWRSVLYILIVVFSITLLLLWFIPWGPQDYEYRFDTSAQPQAKNFTDIPITLLDLKNKKVSLQKNPQSLKELLKAHPAGLLLNFWATWCPPCIEELPSLELYHRQSVKVSQLPKLVLVSVDTTIEPIQTLFPSLDFHPSFFLYLDKKAELAKAMGSDKFPETYLLSPSGEVLYKWIGPQNWLSAEVLDKIKLVTVSHQNK